MASANFWWNFQQLPEVEPIKLYGGGGEEDHTFSEDLDQPEVTFENVFDPISDDEDSGGPVFGEISDSDIDDESIFGDPDDNLE